MAEPLERFKMETNFEGLIQLLAKNLYPEPDVFIRELIQNAHDSIILRQEQEPDLAGQIAITCDGDAQTISFRDNGIGMDKEDIKEFLSVIGSTGTGVAKNELETKGRRRAYELIGQFGIGMLSAFVVASKVLVRTRKLHADRAYAWHNYGSTDCELYADELQSPGSEIVVYVRPDYAFILEPDRIRKAIELYCDFIPFPISLNNEGPVNTINAPWHREYWPSSQEKEAAYWQFLNRRYPDTPLDVIPIELDEPYRVRGALYISDQRRSDIWSTGVVDIFVRRMFIRANDDSFLPRWAKLVRGVIDSPDLQPTAARDNIRRDTPAFVFLQKRLGELIVERLSYLSSQEPSKFRQINRWHHENLKGMAFYYKEFFDQAGSMLLFETNKGYIPLDEYLTKNASRTDLDNRVPIYYFAYEGAAAQFYRLADARGWVVINAGLEYDEELLIRYGQENQNTVHLERLDATDDPVLFERLNPEEQNRFKNLELMVETQLRHHAGLGNVVVRTRRFPPPDLPAVVIVTPENEADERLRRLLTGPFLFENFEDIAREVVGQVGRRPLYLQLNADSPLIQKLAAAQSVDELTQEIMLGIYNSAILYSHNLLNRHNAEVMHHQFIRLFELVISHRAKLAELQQKLEDERSRILELRRRNSETAVERPDHVLLFMITPFDPVYEPLEKAVRQLFEQPPYCFEVLSARDFTHSTALPDNVRAHIRRAHGFITEISELNPNVMFELGAAMMSRDDRPIFLLRSSQADKPIPEDFREQLRITYASLTAPVEQLVAALRQAIERDGRPNHEGIVELLKKRRAHYLSRTLLDGLRTRLDSTWVEALLRQYGTVEHLLDADPAEIARLTGAPSYLPGSLQGELREITIAK